MSDIFDKAFDIQAVTKQFNCLIIKGYLINACKIILSMTKMNSL